MPKWQNAPKCARIYLIQVICGGFCLKIITKIVKNNEMGSGRAWGAPWGARALKLGLQLASLTVLGSFGSPFGEAFCAEIH